MPARLFAIFLIAALAGGTLVSRASGSPQCRGCNIVDEGRLNSGLIGQTVYGRSERGFFAVRVERVDTYPPAIFWRGSNGDGAWDDARSYYSQTAYAELRADGRGGSSPGFLNPIDRESKQRLWAVCLAYKAAKDRAETFGDLAAVWMMERGCCQSSDARRFGTPPGTC